MRLGPLSSAHCAFITGSVSIIVASRGGGLQPSVMRAVGVRLMEDDGALKVYLDRLRAQPVLDHIAANGHAGVVFSRPTTHETLQIKSRHAHVTTVIDDADWAIVERYAPLLGAELATLGFPPAFSRALLQCQRVDTVAVWLQPEAVYDQTPGPVAGRRIDAGASP